MTTSPPFLSSPPSLADASLMLRDIVSASHREAKLALRLTGTVAAALRRPAGFRGARAPERRACEALVHAWLAAQSGHDDIAANGLQLAMALWTRLGDRGRAIQTLLLRAGLKLQAGEVEAAHAAARDALAKAEQAGRADISLQALSALAVIAMCRRQVPQARQYAERAIALAQQREQPGAALWANLAYIHHALAICGPEDAGQAGAAITHAQEACTLAMREQDIWQQALCLALLARCQLHAGPAPERGIDPWPTPPDGLAGDAQHLATLCFIELIRGIASIPRWAGPPQTIQSLSRQMVESFNQHAALQYLIAAVRILKDARIIELMTVFQRIKTSLAGAQARTAELHQAINAMELKMRQLVAEALRDPLTGISNRRHLKEIMAALDADRTRDYAILMIDLDHFKTINDRFSHGIGDEVLIAVARTLQSCAAPQDHIIRHGGEEFLLVMPEASIEHALAAGANIRAAIERIDLQPLPVSITASIGVAAARETPGGAAAIIATADMRLYQAKRQGRNRVVGRPD